MSVLTSQAVVSLTDKRSRLRLGLFTSTHSVDNYISRSIELNPGESEYLKLNGYFSAIFERSTLIQITHGTSTVEVTVRGVVNLPMEGNIRIINPSNTTISDPIRVTYVVSGSVYSSEAVDIQPFVKNFSATDWVLSGDYYTYTILQTTHLHGNAPTVQVYLGTSSYDLVLTEITINNQGDITLRVQSSPDGRFTGRAIIV